MGVHRDGIKRKCLLSTRNRLTTESFHPSPSFSLSSLRRFFFLSLSLSQFLLFYRISRANTKSYRSSLGTDIELREEGRGRDRCLNLASR